MTRQKVINLIKNTIKELQEQELFPKFDIPEIKIERPEEKIHGDYATNVAMIIAKQAGKNPLEIAKIISEKIRTQNPKFLGKVEVVKPGFINFLLSKAYLQKQLKEILKTGEKYGQLKVDKKVHPVKSRKVGIPQDAELFNRVNIEFISANPTGTLHIGHGRGAFFGDCLANVLEKAGYKVIREYYIDDAKNSAQIKELGKTAIGKGNTYLTPYLEHKILKLKPELKKVENESDAGYLLAREIQKDIKNFVEKKLKIKFNNWVSEDSLYKKNKIKKIYNWLKEKDLIYKKEGAEWLRTSLFEDKQDCVVVRTTGEPTYLLSDIAYHKDKFDRKFQKVIDIWGADHQGHIGKIKAAAKMLNYKGDLDILISQVVRLKKGKISKRKGEVITLEWLIDEVGLDACKFIYLMKSLNTQMEFDVELAKEKSQKSPVYYVQYAYARIANILRKYEVGSAKKRRKEIKSSELQISDSMLLAHSSELNLIKQLIRFPEIVEDTATDYQIQRLPKYSIDLAASFHQFYRDCKVISDDKKLTQARLCLILATQTVLKNTLNLMGVSAPEKM